MVKIESFDSTLPSEGSSKVKESSVFDEKSGVPLVSWLIDHLNDVPEHLADVSNVHEKCSKKQSVAPRQINIFRAIESTMRKMGKEPHEAPIKAGMGSKGVNCGKVRYVIACPDLQLSPDHDSASIHAACWKLSCPICKKKVIDRQLRSVMQRYEAYQELHKAVMKQRLKVSHVIWSFPARRFTKKMIMEQGMDPITEEVTRLWKKYNQHPEGGCAYAIHLTRKVHEDGSPCHDKHCKLDHTDEWGPHVHMVGFIYLEKSDKIKSETGMITVKLADTWGYRDLYETLKYELGHTWTTKKIKSGRNQEVVRYLGVLSKRKLSRKTIKDVHENMECKCGNELATWRSLEVEDGLQMTLTGEPDFKARLSPIVRLHGKIYEYCTKRFPSVAYRINTLKLLEREIIHREEHDKPGGVVERFNCLLTLQRCEGNT